MEHIKSLLVEKSPNFTKLRRLAYLFRTSKQVYFLLGDAVQLSPRLKHNYQVRFVMVVTDPIANSRFEAPRQCPDYAKCDPAYPRTRGKEKKFEVVEVRI